MEWYDIICELLKDKMIMNGCMDGLYDANLTLNGLLGMCELMDLSDEFICEAINVSINARNRYCIFHDEKEIANVELIDGDFIWENIK